MASLVIPDGCCDCVIWCYHCLFFTWLGSPVLSAGCCKGPVFDALLSVYLLFIYCLQFVLPVLATYLNSRIWKPKHSYCQLFSRNNRMDFQKRMPCGFVTRRGRSVLNLFFLYRWKGSAVPAFFSFPSASIAVTVFNIRLQFLWPFFFLFVLLLRSYMGFIFYGIGKNLLFSEVN